MVSDVYPACALAGLLVASGCLPDNPDGELTSDTETSSDADTDPTGSTETDGGAQGFLGCATGQTCTLLLVSETLDDRVEIFEPGGYTAYRGSIALDLKPGSSSSDGTLDEPFGIALTGPALHVIAGHYPTREQGSLLSFSRDWLAGYDVGSTVPTEDYFTPGAGFIDQVVHTSFGELEPIFLNPRHVGGLESGQNGRLLIGVFNNDLFTGDQNWTQIGKLAVVDVDDPTNFGVANLSLEGGDCLGASQVVLLDGTQAAVACDGNEAIAFLDLGDVATGEPQAAAAAITGTLCELPGPRNSKRVRYLAPTGTGGVIVQYGPSAVSTSPVGQIHTMGPDCVPPTLPVTVGDGTAQLGELVQFDPAHWLIASGGAGADAERGVFVIQGGADLEVCAIIEGFDWSTGGGQLLTPYGLAVAPDGEHLAVGAAPFDSGNANDGMLGKVLWATLSGTDDPCTMTATVEDLTDGAAGHAPASNPADPSTWRRGPNVVVIEEVQG